MRGCVHLCLCVMCICELVYEVTGKILFFFKYNIKGYTLYIRNNENHTQLYMHESICDLRKCAFFNYVIKSIIISKIKHRNRRLFFKAVFHGFP